MRAQEFVTEAFDQPYPLTWEKSEYGDVDALAKLPDGTNLSIMFNKQQDDDGDDILQVEFYRNDSQEVTGEGDAQKIFATVLTAIQQYVKKYKPLRLTFSASKEVEQGQNAQSRARLYDRLVQRYAKALGYRAFRADNGNVVIYELSRIKQPGVAEGLNEYKKTPLEDFGGLQFTMVKDSPYLRVSAFVPKSERQIAQVDFKLDDQNQLHPEDLHVEERYRGQGVAKTMYDYVKSKGHVIHRSWSQTDAGSDFWDKNRGAKRVWEQGVTESATVTRIDSTPITDFASNLKAYKHTDDWSQSGIDTGDDSYWKNKNLKTNTTKGLFAGDPKRTALYATGNAHETRYVEFTQNGQPVVYFDKKDLPAMRSRKTFLTVFDASNFKKLPTGEWFSENPGKPIKQTPIGDPFKYIADQGWIVRITDNLDKVFKQVQSMHKSGKIAQYGAEGMNEGQKGVTENFADGKVKGKSRPGRVKRAGASCSGSVTDLRQRAKNASGERAKMYHWCANMKSGRKK